MCCRDVASFLEFFQNKNDTLTNPGGILGPPHLKSHVRARPTPIQRTKKKRVIPPPPFLLLFGGGGRVCCVCLCACLFSIHCFFVFYYFGAPCSHLFESFVRPSGVPGAFLGGFVETFSGPRCKQKLVSQHQRGFSGGPFWIFLNNLSKEKRVCGECWLAGSFVRRFPWFSGSPDPRSIAACVVETWFFISWSHLQKGIVFT